MRSTFILIVLAAALAACGEAREAGTRTKPGFPAADATADGADAAMAADAAATPEESFGEGKVVLSEEDLRAKLTDEEYRVTQQCGTEPPFTGKYWNTHTPGVYHCVVCGAPLFSSSTKFESGSGWPSFFRPVSEGAVKEKEDDSFGMRRIEITCGECGAHLGHVFPDGPKPTGLRYCINSAALDLVPAKDAKPDATGADADPADADASR